jgi:hypothetical protein
MLTTYHLGFPKYYGVNKMKQTVLQTGNKTIARAMHTLSESQIKAGDAEVSAADALDGLCVKLDSHKGFCMLPLVDFGDNAKFTTFQDKWCSGDNALFTGSAATIEANWEACRTLYADLQSIHASIKAAKEKKGLTMQKIGPWIQNIKRNMKYCPDAKRSKPATARAKADGIKFAATKKKAATATAAGTRRKAQYLGNALNGDIAARIAEIKSFCDTTGTKAQQTKCKAIESALATLITKVAAIEGVLK